MEFRVGDRFEIQPTFEDRWPNSSGRAGQILEIFRIQGGGTNNLIDFACRASTTTDLLRLMVTDGLVRRLGTATLSSASAVTIEVVPPTPPTNPKVQCGCGHHLIETGPDTDPYAQHRSWVWLNSAVENESVLRTRDVRGIGASKPVYTAQVQEQYGEEFE